MPRFIYLFATSIEVTRENTILEEIQVHPKSEKTKDNSRNFVRLKVVSLNHAKVDLTTSKAS